VPWVYAMSAPPLPGVYTFVFEILEKRRISVGSLLYIDFDEGLYVYVGSARGPGGLRKRIARHASKQKRVRWHIDYLTVDPHVVPRAAVYAVTEDDLEEEIARALMESRIMVPTVKGFGCSDKKSFTHLFKCIESLEKCIDELRHVFTRIGLKPCVLFFS